MLNRDAAPLAERQKGQRLVNDRTRRLIEATLDPQGKWFGQPWLDESYPSTPDLVPLPEDEAVAFNADAERRPWFADRLISSVDEWEPA